ncbi:MAG: amino acid transporter, partial [Candidatus Acidiferrales bacterium]
MAEVTQPIAATAVANHTGFVKGLGLLDSTMIVIGSMIGSGIFIVSADISRLTNSPALLIAAWAIT